MAKHGIRFKPEQIVSLLRQIEVLTANSKALDEACKYLSIAIQSYYRWRKIYGGIKADQAKRFTGLEMENTRLKTLVADPSLREAMFQEVINGIF